MYAILVGGFGLFLVLGAPIFVAIGLATMAGVMLQDNVAMMLIPTRIFRGSIRRRLCPHLC